MTLKFLQSLVEAPVNTLQKDLKNADTTDAGSTDVTNKAHSTDDVSFSTMRNVINSDGEITGSDVADYIERAEELNDEVDTIAYGLETDDGNVVKVYVNAEQSDDFEEALRNMLGVEEDIEETLNRLAGNFDIVDVIWPTNPETEDHTIAQPEDGEQSETHPEDDPYMAALQAGQGLTPTSIAGGEDDVEDDDFEIIAALPGDDSVVTQTAPVPDDGSANPETLPDVPENEEGDVWSKLNDMAIAEFGSEEDSEILGIRDLTADQLDKFIDVAKADEIAQNQYEAADFLSMDEDEQKEIIEANPTLIRSDEDEEEEGSSESEEKVEVESSPEAEEETEEEPEEKKEVPESKKFSFLNSLLS